MNFDGSIGLRVYLGVGLGAGLGVGLGAGVGIGHGVGIGVLLVHCLEDLYFLRINQKITQERVGNRRNCMGC